MHTALKRFTYFLSITKLIAISKRTYFASDFHLGSPDHKESLEREHAVVSWLDEVANDAESIYLVGDLFDFWFEYKRVVPRGHVRLLGKLAELKDAGINLHVFTGNHDMWMFGYFEEELGIPVHKEPLEIEIGTKKFLVGHGDGLGPGDKGYKFLKRIFSSKASQWLFARLHPNLGIRIARYWSSKSRYANEDDESRINIENEWLVAYCKELLKKEFYDYFIFGHRHYPLDINIGEKSRYINLGDWITHFSYAVFDNNEIELKHYKK